VAHKSRFIVRAAGEFDFARDSQKIVSDTKSMEAEHEDENEVVPTTSATQSKEAKAEVDIFTYRPNVRDRVWYVSETDLLWIASGCYILGTGGGGSPYSQMLALRQLLREGSIVRVVNPHDLADDATVASGHGAGSPTVSIEKLSADEMMEAQTELYKVCDTRPTHMISLEIGGGNGLQGMILGASSNMNIPCVDGDWMGRAYPVKQMT